MATPRLRKELAQQLVDTINQCIVEGFRTDGAPSAYIEAARRLKIAHSTVFSRKAATEKYYPELLIKNRAPENKLNPEQLEALIKREIRSPKSLSYLIGRTGTDVAVVLDTIESLMNQGLHIHRRGETFEIPRYVDPAFMSEHVLEIISEKDNTFTLGVVSDNHCGSKYERRDVLDDLYDIFAENGVQIVLHAGNWIDGDARFNRHDLLAHGVEAQCRLLADTYPRRDGIITYAIWGDDHEGWYAQREGIDVGVYCETVMRKQGREDWVNLGFMDAPIPLINSNEGTRCILSLVHPGGGSAYALSYSIQKIIESLEGGEKPAVGIYGHYHKMWSGNIRNVWCLQSGCAQDQTPFMRKNKLEAQVGGTLLRMVQHPESGSIVRFCPDMIRYFNKGFIGGNRWSHHGPVHQPERSIGGL